MPLYRVWFNDKRSNEVEDGRDYEAASQRQAAMNFTRDEYSTKQHVDPGSCFVRDPTGRVTRWRVSYSVSFDATLYPMTVEEAAEVQ